MTVTSEFYKGTDWESSSGPVITRQFAIADLWPVGDNSESDNAGDKDALEAGLHPVVAIGPKASRPTNLTGVVITADAAAGLCNVNVAPMFACKQYVANVLTYNGGAAATFDQSLDIGEPVFVDDSVPLDSGITLSRSPLNDAGNANPLAGYLWYDQDEYLDGPVGGKNAAAVWPKTVANSLTYTKVTVLLTNAKLA